MSKSTGPACGNNPNYRMSDGDRQAVEDFKEYLANRAAVERVRTVLETEAVVGRSALEYRGLIASALMADDTQSARPPADADCNTGPGWYEVISPRATTCIAYVHEDGSLYLPEGDALTHEEFAFAAARGNAHKLVRADETQPLQSRPARKQLLTLSTPCAVCSHPYNWHQGGICQAASEESRCGCIAFAQAQQDGAQS